MRELALAWMPNKVISAKTFWLIATVQAFIALLIWINSPWKALPVPPEVWRAFVHLWFEMGLSHEIYTSFLLNLEALAFTLIISLSISYLTVLPVMRPLALAISKGRFLGLMGLPFVFTLMFGGGHNLKVALLTFGMTVFFVTSMVEVVARIPKAQFDHARTLRMSEWRVVWEVVILGTRHKAIEVFRQNAAIGWMMIAMVEGISRADGGVGALLLAENKHFKLPEVFAIQLMILFGGLLVDYGIGIIERIVSPYARLSLERR